MGAVYSVIAKIKAKDAAKAVSALKKYIRVENNATFTLPGGKMPEDLDGMAEVFLTDDVTKKADADGFTVYDAGFDVSYGWGRILCESFEAMAPYLEAGSYLDMYPDEEHVLLTVQEDGSVKYED